MESKEALKRQLNEVPTGNNDRGFMKYAKVNLGHTYAKYQYCKRNKRETLTLDEGRRAVEKLATELFGIPMYTRPPVLKAQCPTCKTTTTFTHDTTETTVAPPMSQLDIDNLIRETRLAVEQTRRTSTTKE